MPLAQRVGLHVCEMPTPSDTSTIAALFDNGVSADAVVAVIGNSEGTGYAFNGGRELADLCIRETLGAALGLSRAEVADRVPIIISGGTYSVMTPHMAVVTRETVDIDASELTGKRLVVGTAFSETILPEDIGRMGQIRKVAAAVVEAQQDAGVSELEDVHCVMVKTPGITAQGLADAVARGKDLVSYDLGAGKYGAMPYANDGAALGVALGLGEIAEEALSDDAVRRDWSLYSNVAATSAAGEKTRAEVLLLGNAEASVSELRIGHGIAKDIIDTSGIKEAYRSAGLKFDCCPSTADLQRVVHVIAKGKTPENGMIRGHRTMVLESIPEMIKASVASIVASTTGTTTSYVSAGERNSHQGPPEGFPIAAVIRV